jgi:hypothetical protein
MPAAAMLVALCVAPSVSRRPSWQARNEPGHVGAVLGHLVEDRVPLDGLARVVALRSSAPSHPQGDASHVKSQVDGLNAQVFPLT